MKVAVIGAGYVGLTTALSLAYVGHEVVGVDLDADKVARLNRGELPFYRHSAPLPPCLRILGWKPHPTYRSTTWATWAWWLACWTESGWWRPWTASWALGPGKRSPPVWPSRPLS